MTQANTVITTTAGTHGSIDVARKNAQPTTPNVSTVAANDPRVKYVPSDRPIHRPRFRPLPRLDGER